MITNMITIIRLLIDAGCARAQRCGVLIADINTTEG
jgi:hypothetical protein